MVISDGNNVDRSSVPTITIASMELEVSTSTDETNHRKSRKGCIRRCLMNRAVQGFIVGIIICVVIVVAFMHSVNKFGLSSNKNDANQLEEKPIIFKTRNQESKSTTTLPPRICGKEECTLSANHLLRSMDLTVNPCEDFYKFACGGWEKMLSDPPPELFDDSTAQINQFNLMNEGIKRDVLELLQEDHNNNSNNAFKKARKMYQSCMNTDAISEAGKEPLIQLLDPYGGWPIITPNWNESNFNWKNATSSLLIQWGIHIFFNITTIVDLENGDNNIILITSSYVPDELLGKLEGLISDRLSPNFTESKAFQRDLNDLKNFRAKLNDIPVFTLEDCNSSCITSLRKLQSLTDTSLTTMDWVEYLDGIFSVLHFNVDWGERILADANYLTELFQLLKKTTPRVVANYLHWKIVESTIEDTEEGLSSDRETFCFSKMQLMEPAVIPEYVKKYFPLEHRREIMKLVDNLKTAFLKTFYEREMSMRISSLKELVGYPDWITYNTTFLDSYYQGLEVSEETYFKNICSIKRFLTMNDLKSLRRKRTIDDEYDRSSLMTPRAFYNRLSNSIGMSLSLLRPPIYRKGDLMATNYGSIGFILGHEIGHSIVIAKLQKVAEYVEMEVSPSMSWYSFLSKTREASAIANQIKCFIDQYNSYKIAELNEFLDGRLTVKENIADLLGITFAFKAYQSYVALNGVESRLPGLEQFSPEQIFFISFASSFCMKYANNEILNITLQHDEHTVAPYRVIGALSNSYAFSEHFKCPPSRMNPSNKCTLD